MGCSIATEMIAPAGNFLLGLYNADNYYSKECSWYEEVRFEADTKTWLIENSAPKVVLEDIAKVARNNDLFKEVCDVSN